MAEPALQPDLPIQLRELDYYFGEGKQRRQVLYGLDLEIRAGEIVILTGPSGSGKTTALTLIGALRTAQEGSLRILGTEMVGARRGDLVRIRRQIGYIFQHHNLLEALTATQNVTMALALHGGLSKAETKRRAVETLEAVGLGHRVDAHPSSMSGGEKQRVAIARALVTHPRLVLADEPTASLDKKSGRDVVNLMQDLAREQGATVVLVTHDNRILDVADRIVHLEDGRITSFGEAVLNQTRLMMNLLTESNRKGELARRVVGMPANEFAALLEQVTREAHDFLHITELASNSAFESMLDQLLEAFTLKVGDILEADRASLFLLDTASGELWSKVARDGGGAPFEIRIPSGTGIAGAVAASGEPINLEDAYADPRFRQDVDRDSNYRTRSLLCVPMLDRAGAVFGVAQILNRRDGQPFDDGDLARFQDFMALVGVVLESWWRMTSTPNADSAVD